MKVASVPAGNPGDWMSSARREHCNTYRRARFTVPSRELHVYSGVAEAMSMGTSACGAGAVGGLKSAVP